MDVRYLDLLFLLEGVSWVTNNHCNMEFRVWKEESIEASLVFFLLTARAVYSFGEGVKRGEISVIFFCTLGDRPKIVHA